MATYSFRQRPPSHPAPGSACPLPDDVSLLCRVTNKSDSTYDNRKIYHNIWTVEVQIPASKSSHGDNEFDAIASAIKRKLTPANLVFAKARPELGLLVFYFNARFEDSSGILATRLISSIRALAHKQLLVPVTAIDDDGNKDTSAVVGAKKTKKEKK